MLIVNKRIFAESSLIFLIFQIFRQRRMLLEIYEAVKESSTYAKVPNNNLGKRPPGNSLNIQEYYNEMIKDIGGYYRKL